MQFTPPSIPDALSRCREGGCPRIVAIPVFPLCGPTTSVAALDTLRTALSEMEWQVPVVAVAGWHRHPAYVRIRAEGVRAFCRERRLDPGGVDTLLHFSAHGTPLRYLREGSRYLQYVEESCRAIAGALGVDRFALGFQNHTGRGGAWTGPENRERIRSVQARHLVVVPVSFMHEQSETLVDLDEEFRSEVEGRGMQFHRVPVPHRDPRFARLLADLAAAAGDGGPDSPLVSCHCVPAPWACCVRDGMRGC